MPVPLIDFARKIKDILRHVQPLADEAKAPILHYQRTVTDLWGTREDVEQALARSDYPERVVAGHLARLNGMVLINLVETFERFLKEVAAVCVDCLAGVVLDDRFNSFPIQGSSLASHFGAGTLGKSLCESTTWLDCTEINDRFRKLLSDPFQATGAPFYLFPKSTHLPEDERWRIEVMALVWQLRHTMVHNVGVITRSDAVKLAILSREAVAFPVSVAPTRDDLGFLKQFLNNTTEVFNDRIGKRLAELLTTIHAQAPTLVHPGEMATRITNLFKFVVRVGDVDGVLEA